MRILFLSILLCLNYSFVSAQQTKTGNQSFILVNGAGCEDCTIERTRSSLKKISLSVDAKYSKIISFSAKMPGRPTIKIKGSTSNSEYAKHINYAGVGKKISIFNIKTEKGTLDSYINIRVIK